MNGSLPDNTNNNLLKKQAKKLLKQVREDNPHALTTVNTHYPRLETFAGLRDAQLVIARRYGFSGWSELSEAVELAQHAEKNLSDKATLFIQLGCVQYSGNDTLRNYQRARNLLAAYPEISAFTFYTALVSNNARAVSEFLKSDSSLAVTAGGPLVWPPLLYATYSRIGESEDTRNSLSIVKQLLEYGANPDSHVMLNNTYRFTALTGAMGEGEQGVNQPPHQYADEMAALLLNSHPTLKDDAILLHVAAKHASDRVVKALLAQGFDINGQSEHGRTEQRNTVLHVIGSWLHDEPEHVKYKSMLDWLVSAGADINAKNKQNQTPVQFNLAIGSENLAELLNDYS